MKKMIALIMIVVMVLSFAGCCCVSMTECDLCGEMGFHPKRTNILGSAYPVCNDCYNQFDYLFD